MGRFVVGAGKRVTMELACRKYAGGSQAGFGATRGWDGANSIEGTEAAREGLADPSPRVR